MDGKVMWEFAGSVILVAMIFVMVRPGSAGAQMVVDIGETFASLIRTITV